MATDQAEQLAAGRRQRRVLAVPEPLRPAVQSFCDFMIRSRERSRRAGTLPRTDATTEATLANLRDLALFLAGERGKRNWALTDVHDLEALLANSPKPRSVGWWCSDSSSASRGPGRASSWIPPAV
ncbi:hypothetical protein [Streptomyces sp. NPDC058623]|uniref:hypothetical protein n=1 Tax=Streptomyces sp. NPDC058623 TaxID=3346563 RepID=UPI00364FD26B